MVFPQFTILGGKKQVKSPLTNGGDFKNEQPKNLYSNTKGDGREGVGLGVISCYLESSQWVGVSNDGEGGSFSRKTS